ncbi:hypothetical protein RFI_10985, partial [Reticulomyxa filosa]
FSQKQSIVSNYNAIHTVSVLKNLFCLLFDCCCITKRLFFIDFVKLSFKYLKKRNYEKRVTSYLCVDNNGENSLVLECTPRYNWYEIFAGAKLTSGEEVKVEQATWQEVSLTAYHDSGLVVTLAPAKSPHENAPDDKQRTCKPDFILFRTLSQHIQELTHKNFLYAVQFSNVATMNSTQALYGMLEKPWVYGELKRIQKKLGGYDKFPLIDQT